MNEQIQRTQRRRLRRRPNGAAAFGSRPIGSVFLIINIYGYALNIPYTFLMYSMYNLPTYVPYIFPCVFLNSWSQQKTNPYRKTTFIFFPRFYAFHIFT